MGKIFVLNDEGIERLLSTALVGRIACATLNEGDGRPYIVPLAYGYDGEAVYAMGPLGRKILIMREQPLVSFEVDEAAAEDRWSSVVAEGRYEELTMGEDRLRAARIITKDEGASNPPEETIVYRLVLTKKSGRFELPDDEAAIYEAQMNTVTL